MKRYSLLTVCLALWTIGPVMAQNNPVVVMKTSMGTVKIELNAKKAPITVKNFLSYVDAKHYDNTIFHRVIGTFMIQGGGFSKAGVEKATNRAIENESKNGLSNAAGTIAMARTGNPHSATAQFYINVEDNARGLDGSPTKWGYAVFGKVVEGMDVINKIKKVRTGTRKMTARLPTGKLLETEFANVPLTTVVIQSIRRVKAK